MTAGEVCMRYADIIVDNKSKHIDNLFTYRVADDSIQVGDRVNLTFGQSDKEKSGYVYRFCDAPSDCPEDKIKEIMIAYEDKYFKTKNGKGIAFTIPITSVIGVSIYQFLSNSMEKRGE